MKRFFKYSLAMAIFCFVPAQIFSQNIQMPELLVSSYSNSSVYKLDVDGKIVWSYNLPGVCPD